MHTKVEKEEEKKMSGTYINVVLGGFKTITKLFILKFTILTLLRIFNNNILPFLLFVLQYLCNWILQILFLLKEQKKNFINLADIWTNAQTSLLIPLALSKFPKSLKSWEADFGFNLHYNKFFVSLSFNWRLNKKTFRNLQTNFFCTI